MKAGDARDSEGRNRFFPFEPGFFLNKASLKTNFWFWDYAMDKVNIVNNSGYFYTFI